MKTVLPIFSTACFCVGIAAAYTLARAVEPPDAPAALRPAADQVLALTAAGSGVQIYECKPAQADPSRYEWTFKAPEAELADATGHVLGKHYAGPTWESTDGSRVVGEVKAHDSGPDANAIPWLLLGAKSTSGAGVFGHVTGIQRLQTAGGKAPTTACGKDNAQALARVPYKAMYYFYTSKP
ncbi:MAG TPA: DUF3455 domain-containing protein [Dokdonella sp.]